MYTSLDLLQFINQWEKSYSFIVDYNNNNENEESSLVQWSPPRQYFCRGNYFRLQGVSPPPFSHLIYPVPDQRGGLGVHATLSSWWSSWSLRFQVISADRVVVVVSFCVGR